VACVVLAGARAAHAECSDARSALFPLDGTLPANPTLYLFVADQRMPELRIADDDGLPVGSRIEPIGGEGALSVYRVQLFRDHGEVDIVLGDGDLAPRRHYHIERGHQVDPRTVIARVRLDDYDWPCSFTHAVDLEVQGEAAAYRLVWYRGDHTGEALLPPATAALFQYRGAPPPEKLEVQIGHVSCLGLTVAHEVYDDGAYVQLSALFSDGSEMRIGDGTIGLARTDAVVPSNLIGVYPTAARPRLAPGAPPEPAAWPPRALAVRAGEVAAGLLGLALLLRLRRRLRRGRAMSAYPRM
jgi:hypothetical protein